MRLMLAAILSATAILVGDAAAQTSYPERSVRIVVGFPPGSQSDTIARLVGQKFAEAWGKPVLVDNAAGAAGNIAADRTAKAAPDGHTLALLSQTEVAVNPSLYKLAYDPVRDLAPVTQVTVSPNLLVVHNAVPARNVEELVKLARTRPGELTFATGGSGSSPHLAAELLKSVAGLDIRHVPYKGVVAAIPDLLGGRVTMMLSPPAIVLPMTREGKLRALAVTSARRSPAAPELPTIAESGFPGFEFTAWNGLFAPAGVPATIVSKLYLETAKALMLPDLRARFATLGLEAVGNSPDEFAGIIKRELAKWAKLIGDSGMKPD